MISNLKWNETEFPSEIPGEYLILTENTVVGSRYSVAVVRRISKGCVTTIGGFFVWDILDDNRIVAWADLNEMNFSVKENP